MYETWKIHVRNNVRNTFGIAHYARLLKLKRLCEYFGCRVKNASINTKYHLLLRNIFKEYRM